MSKTFGELVIGDQFMFENELCEKITPIKTGCCGRGFTAKKVGDGANITIKNHVQVEPVGKEE